MHHKEGKSNVSVDGTFYKSEGFKNPWKKVGKMLSHGMTLSGCV